MTARYFNGAAFSEHKTYRSYRELQVSGVIKLSDTSRLYAASCIWICIASSHADGHPPSVRCYLSAWSSWAQYFAPRRPNIDFRWSAVIVRASNASIIASCNGDLCLIISTRHSPTPRVEPCDVLANPFYLLHCFCNCCLTNLYSTVHIFIKKPSVATYVEWNMARSGIRLDAGSSRNNNAKSYNYQQNIS